MPEHQWRRQLRRSVPLVLTLALVLGACSSKSGGEKAADAVTAGLAAHVAGRLDDAEKEYRKALDADANNTSARYNLGLIAQTRGDAAAAELEYRAVLAIDPRFAPALFNLAILRTAAGSFDEAIALYRRTIAVNTNDANAHLNLGFALQQQGKKAEGQAELNRAVQLNPALSSRIPQQTSSPKPASGPSETPG